MSKDEQFSQLVTGGVLVKRPILMDENFVLVGFRQSEWEEQRERMREALGFPGIPSFPADFNRKNSSAA